MADAAGMRLDDIGKPLVVIREAVRFAEQLRRVAHCAHRVTDLVRNTSTQAPEGRQFRLLHARVQDTRVLQEYQ